MISPNLSLVPLHELSDSVRSVRSGRSLVGRTEALRKHFHNPGLVSWHGLVSCHTFYSYFTSYSYITSYS